MRDSIIHLIYMALGQTEYPHSSPMTLLGSATSLSIGSQLFHNVLICQSIC